MVVGGRDGTDFPLRRNLPPVLAKLTYGAEAFSGHPVTTMKQYRSFQVFAAVMVRGPS